VPHLESFPRHRMIWSDDDDDDGVVFAISSFNLFLFFSTKHLSLVCPAIKKD
jgi:hypothetical protein